jgi:hypothetical protein
MLVLSPNAPFQLDPHAHKVPSDFKTTVELDPAEICGVAAPEGSTPGDNANRIEPVSSNPNNLSLFAIFFPSFFHPSLYYFNEVSIFVIRNLGLMETRFDSASKGKKIQFRRP